jgi:murein DD-endopeptidase MepM/ murein hydrolase activator NlpD
VRARMRRETRPTAWSRWGGCGLSLLVLIAIVLPDGVLARTVAESRGRRASGGAATGASSGAARRAAGPSEVHHIVRRGDTLSTVLARYGVGAREAQRWMRIGKQRYDFRRLRPGHRLTLTFDRGERRLASIRCEVGGGAVFVLERSGSAVATRQPELPHFVRTKGIAGRVQGDLYRDASQAGMPPRLIAQFADVFGWDIDLENDIRPGDEFRALYEEVHEAGLPEVQARSLLAAEIRAGERVLRAVYFEDDEGEGRFYRPEGMSIGRAFLRYPVEFSEITSMFSEGRVHPILRRRRPHLGVDFAAPRGTPVRAIADGEIVRSGWDRRAGRYVSIGHADRYESSYAHLQAFAPEVQAGTRVRRGQVIGYVGATGMATGPHLHFALFRDGVYLNPLEAEPPVEAPIRASVRRAFDRACQRLLGTLAALRPEDGILTLSFDRLTTDARLPTGLR